MHGFINIGGANSLAGGNLHAYQYKTHFANGYPTVTVGTLLRAESSGYDDQGNEVAEYIIKAVVKEVFPDSALIEIQDGARWWDKFEAKTIGIDFVQCGHETDGAEQSFICTDSDVQGRPSLNIFTGISSHYLYDTEKPVSSIGYLPLGFDPLLTTAGWGVYSKIFLFKKDNDNYIVNNGTEFKIKTQKLSIDIPNKFYLDSETEQIRFGTATDLTTGDGVFIGKDTNYVFRIGLAAAQRFVYDSTSVSIYDKDNLQVFSTDNLGAFLAGWNITDNVIQSSISGARVALIKDQNRVSVFDAVGEKVAMGYLDGLPKADGSGNWSASDYGFWAKPGNTLRIDGNVEYMSNGDWIIHHDANYLIQDSLSNVVGRFGTDTGEMGVFIYDTAGTQLAKFHSAGISIGNTSYYLGFSAATGVLDLKGNVQITGGATRSELNNMASSISTNAGNINLKVSKNNVINEINISTEAIKISGDNIEINGFTTFASGYNPAEKIATGGAASDINVNTTTVNGGKITTNTITLSHLNFTPVEDSNVIAKINASSEGIKISGGNIELDGNTSVLGSFSVSGDVVSGGIITGSTLQTAASGKRIVLSRISNSIEIYGDFGYSGSIYGSPSGLARTYFDVYEAVFNDSIYAPSINGGTLAENSVLISAKYAAISHTHSAVDINSGTLDRTRLPDWTASSANGGNPPTGGANGDVSRDTSDGSIWLKIAGSWYQIA